MARAAKPIGDTEQIVKELPDAVQTERDLPQVGSPENTVTIGGKLIEIKPTKLLYQRNCTAAFYKM